MDMTTLIIYIVLYIYGFSLMIWAIFFDKRPTKKTLYAAWIGLGILLLTLLYFIYALTTVGIIDSATIEKKTIDLKTVMRGRETIMT